MRPDDAITRFEMVPWFHGRILDISEGTVKTFHHFIWYMDALIADPWSLDMFADASLDGVVSSNLLHLMPMDDVCKSLQAWTRVIREGGHIVFHLPLGQHQWNVSRVTIVELMSRLPCGWDLVYCQTLETGLLMSFKLKATRAHAFSCDIPKPEKTCAVTRLGAFGDMIQASSILPWLKEQGYHITLYCSDNGFDVAKHDPHIDRFIIQGANEVPPQVLGKFWEHEEKKYDRWINLSSTVEETLLATPGSAFHGWSNDLREKYMDRNYLEFTHEVAGVPPPYRPKFYSTLDEREWARFQKRKMGRRNILWSLSGSSVHKTWPHMDSVIASILLNYDDVHVVLVGDDLCKVLETGWFKWVETKGNFADASKRVHCRSGQWSIRKSMAFAEVADLIIGTETGLLNAAGSMETPKIVTLSHSSEEMLTKHWKNVTALAQPKGNGCPMQPCRLLHYGWESCMRDEATGTAACQSEITAEMMMSAVVNVLGEPVRKVA